LPLHDDAAKQSTIASDATAIACYKIASKRNHRHIAVAGYFAGNGDLSMRMFETVTSSLLAIAAQALVVGVVISTL
jgi:hypothetical protein